MSYWLTLSRSTTMQLRTPKLSSADRQGYPYYAGFSTSFVRSLLEGWRLPKSSIILDPWNGSGTTTSTAGALGYSSIGLDLNPVAVVLARGRSLDRSAARSLVPLGHEIVEEASWLRADPYGDEEPLLAWFDPPTSRRIRRLEMTVRYLLVDRDQYLTWGSSDIVENLSSLASFYLSALFLVVRRLMQPLIGSNPTWIQHRAKTEPISRAFSQLAVLVRDAVGELAEAVACRESTRAKLDVQLGDSREILLPPGSVDAVVTSPPYCTRLDYVVATLPELAVLGCHPQAGASTLRKRMLGTILTGSTDLVESRTEWGRKCRRLLRHIARHPSKASSSYYSVFFTQYFAGLYESLVQLRRVTRPGGRVAVVVQDSHYKEIPVNLGEIVAEMGSACGWTNHNLISFDVPSPLVRINVRARRHLSTRTLAEHAVLFEDAK